MSDAEIVERRDLEPRAAGAGARGGAPRRRPGRASNVAAQRARAASAPRPPRAAPGRAITAKCASANSASGSRQVPSSANASLPIRKTGSSRRDPPAERAQRIDRDTRARRARPRARRPRSAGCPRTARAHPGEPLRGRRERAARAARLVRRLAGRHEQHALERERSAHFLRGAQVAEVDRVEGAAEARRCAPGSFAKLALAVEHELLRRQALEPHRTVGVQPRGRDADLGAEPEPVAVRERGRAVDAHGRRVHAPQEALRARVVAR